MNKTFKIREKFVVSANQKNKDRRFSWFGQQIKRTCSILKIQKKIIGKTLNYFESQQLNIYTNLYILKHLLLVFDTLTGKFIVTNFISL